MRSNPKNFPSWLVRGSIKCLSRWLPIEGTVSLCTLKNESPPPKDMLPASDAMTSRKRNEHAKEAIRRGETPGQERCG